MRCSLDRAALTLSALLVFAVAQLFVPGCVNSEDCCGLTSGVTETVQRFCQLLNEGDGEEAKSCLCRGSGVDLHELCKSRGATKDRLLLVKSPRMRVSTPYLAGDRLATQVSVFDPNTGKENVFVLHAEAAKWKIADLRRGEGTPSIRRRSRSTVVDLSTPMTAFRSYLDAYESMNPRGMYACMSRRLQLACYCETADQFCKQIGKSLERRSGHQRVLDYYRSLLPVIERAFARCPQATWELEVALPGKIMFEGETRRSRLAFVRQFDGWRLDALDVCVPREAEDGNRTEQPRSATAKP